ncbi:MAG: DUF3772 domain-containing protein [Parvularculaceae bacterium]
MGEHAFILRTALVAFLTLIGALAAPAFAQAAASPETGPAAEAVEEKPFDLAAARKTIERQEAALDKLTTRLADMDDNDGPAATILRAEAEAARTALEAVADGLKAARKKARARVEALEALVDGGDAPPKDDGDPVEAGAEGPTDADLDAAKEDLAKAREEAERLGDAQKSAAAGIGRAVRQRDEVDAQARLDALQLEVNARRREIEEAERRLNAAEDATALVAVREELRALRTAAETAVAPIRVARDEAQDDLDRLGVPPAEGEPAEAPEIAAERQRLNATLAQDDAIIRQSDLDLAEINRLLEDIVERRRDEFYDEILTRGPFPLDPAILASAAASLVAGFGEAQADVGDWLETKRRDGGLNRSLAALCVIGVVGLLLFGPTQRWASRSILQKLQATEPTPGRRAVAALVRVAARAIPSVAAAWALLQGFKAVGLVDADNARLAGSALAGVVALIIADAGGAAAFSPTVPGWRLVPLDRGCIAPLRATLLTLALIFFADRTFSVAAQVYGGDKELALAQSALVAIAMGAIYLFISQRRLWRLADGREEAVDGDVKSVLGTARLALRFVGVAIVAAALLGYVALAHYAATRVFMLGGIASLGFFVRAIAHEALRGIDANGRAKRAKAAGEEETETERLLFFWIGAFVDLMIILALTPIAFLALGADWSDVRAAVADALFGFKVGNVTISLAQILFAAATFAGVLFAARFIQRMAANRFLPRTRLDSGAQNSLKTLIGYVGLVIAAMSSVSVLGFNLSNLAIIAGALSVGIGFGLQSIVNNFVSGLILLFERPIKVGDWIVTTSGEGIVKRISVRSTEIETFDRSSVIVPNSELVSGAVTNWTHKDKIGRVIVPVGVSYDNDPEEIIKLLEEVAKDSPILMGYPAPFIYFAGFGDSSLDFELRGFVRDVGSMLGARTRLRVEVFNKLKKAGVTIPFPQRDVHVIPQAGFGGLAQEAPPSDAEPAAPGGPDADMKMAGR